MAVNGATESKSYSEANTSSLSPNRENEGRDGKWLCDEGPYLRYIQALCGSNPGLRKADPANEKTPLKPGNATVALLEAPISGVPKFTKQDFISNMHLKDHFATCEKEHNRRRIYVMEGLAPDYIATIGGHFFMDPSFFQRQERTCVWSNKFTPTSDALPPPTSLDPEKMFHLQYCELRRFKKVLPNSPFFCKRTGRHVGMTAGRQEETTTAAILRRKVAWWSRRTSGGGWDVVILCDPQLGELRQEPLDKAQRRKLREERGDENLLESLKNTAFQDGYVDFVPPPSPDRAASIPRHPHHSMLKDLCYYLETHSALLDEEEWNEPITSSFFLKKIVVAHYLQLIDYIKAMLPSLELRLTTAWRDEQEQWKSLQTISRRCGNYGDDIEDTLLSLGYSLETFQNSARPDWKDCRTDFQYVYFRLKILKQRADTLMQAMTGLASIAGNRQNLEEAKRVKRLNLLALLFIPLAYTSSLFSMQDNYAPGNGQFWIYWVSALTVVALTLFMTWILDSALDDAAQWRLGPFKWSRVRANIKSVKRSPTIYPG